MKYFLPALLLAIFFSQPVLADCTSPAAPAGQMDYFGAPHNGFKYCDGTNWVNMDVAKTVTLAGVLTPSTITSNQNNYAPANLDTATVLRLATDAARNITGLTAGTNGRVITILNIGTNDIVLKNQDAASSAANRFALGADITVGADESVSLLYDATSQRWRAAGAPFDSSGGGGGCAGETWLFENPGLMNIYVPQGCTTATMEAWGAGGGVGVSGGTSSGKGGGGGGGSVVVRDTGNVVLVAGGGGGGGGGHINLTSVNTGTGGGGGYGKTANNIAVTPGEMLRVYVGGGGGSGCGVISTSTGFLSPYLFSGGDYQGGVGARNGPAASSTYGGGGGGWGTTTASPGGTSVYGGAGGCGRRIEAPATSTYGGNGGICDSTTTTAQMGGRGGGGIGATVINGSNGNHHGGYVGGTAFSIAGGAGAVGGGLSAGAGAGTDYYGVSDWSCDPRGEPGRVRIVWSN